MTDFGWSNQQLLNLIEEYRNRPMLWDRQNKRYRDQASRYAAWWELAVKFNSDIFELRKKFNSMFASYRREKCKVRSGGRSTWFLYNHLSFLPNHVEVNEMGLVEKSGAVVKKRAKKKSIEVSEEEESNEENEENGTESPVEIIIKDEPEIEEVPSPKIKCVTPKPYLTRVPKRRIGRDNFVERKKIFKRKFMKNSEMYKRKDECDTFGEYIAMSLRKHDERTQSMIKQAINNILFEQEMNKYNNGQYAVVVSSMEENPLILGDECDKQET